MVHRRGAALGDVFPLLAHVFPAIIFVIIFGMGTDLRITARHGGQVKEVIISG